MYHSLLDRRRDAVTACVQLLSDSSRDMALDPRFYHHIGHPGPGSISSAASSDISAATGITSPSIISTSASAATLRSTASSPSFRAREGFAIARTRDGMASPIPGGNVRVVVRVRKFLPRGRCCLGGMRGGAITRKWRAYILTSSCRNRSQGGMFDFDGPAHADDLPSSTETEAWRSRKTKVTGPRQDLGR